jgi:RNA polymerase sigma factor (sigma-70 family)
MASDPNHTVLRQIDRLFQGGTITSLDEGQLLDRFVADRDEQALETIVEWHGPMVLGVCRRWLGNPHDIDDAFQATFLILVRKARALRDVDRLGPWLHGVAYRVAARARADAARRRSLEQAGARPECDTANHSPDGMAVRAEVCNIVDEEVARLPASLRDAIVLCDLEGRSHDDAARRLGWSEGTLRGRLARARQKLRRRLERRGLAPAVWPAGGPLLSELLPASPTPALIKATTRAVTASILAGRAAPPASTVISASVIALAQGVIRTMTLSTIKTLTAAAILAAIGVLAVGGFVRAGLARLEAENQPVAQAPKAVNQKAGTKTLDLRVVRRSDRQPVAGAMVEVASSDQSAAREVALTTDNQGHCLVVLAKPTTILRISVAKDGFVPISHSWKETDLLPETYTQELESGQPIGGFVKNEQGRPIDGADVTVAIDRRTDDMPNADVPIPGNLKVFAGFPNIRVKTDHQGRWQCSILPMDADPATRLWFLVTHPDYVSDTAGYSRRLSLKTARAMSGSLIMSSGVTVRGEVRDAKGQAVAGARVVIAYSPSSAETLRAMTDTAGRFVFAHANNRNGLGRWSLGVEAVGFAPAWKLIVPNGEVPPVDFRLSPGKPFRGRVVDNKGRPVEGVAISVRWEECYHLNWKAMTDADGRFIWPDAPGEGEIAFNLRKAGYNGAFDRSVSAVAGRAELTINPQLRARGKVIDAVSKELVRSFLVIPATNFEGDREIDWQRPRGVKGSEGHFEIAESRYDQPKTVYRFRIESDGYAPATSRPVKPDEGEVTLDFALEKARPTSGVVQLPDGAPAAGAEVYMNGRGATHRLDGPPPAPRYLAEFRRKTGADGRYSFPPGDTRFGIVAVHDKGFGDRKAEEMAGSPDVTLRPWGRIEGVFRIRGKPAVHERIDVNLDRTEIAPRYTYQEYSAITDDQGRFVIERVMDGEASFTWASGQSAKRALSSAGPAVNVRAGQTTHVDLGGQGRPLIGRIVLSPVEGARDGEAIVPVTPTNAHGWIEIKPAQMPMPVDFMTWDATKRQQYTTKWYGTEAGKAYLRNRRFHMFPVAPDGRFRIEDITPGSYNLSITAGSTPGLTHPTTRNRVDGTIERDVEVAPIPGGHTDEPLDLGTMPLKLEVKK